MRVLFKEEFTTAYNLDNYEIRCLDLNRHQYDAIRQVVTSLMEEEG